MDESGALFADVAYSVSFTNAATIGGYGITQVLGPPGTPLDSCAGGNLAGGTSGSCR